MILVALELELNPLTRFYVQDDYGRWMLVGVVSAGYSCAKPGQPGIYHRYS